MEYKVISYPSPESLTMNVNHLIKEGWEPVGSHTAVITKETNRYSGQQHMDTIYRTEYSQTLIKK